MKTLVLAAALVFSLAAPATTAPAALPLAAAPVPQPVWPLVLSGLAAAFWVARRRLHHTL